MGEDDYSVASLYDAVDDVVGGGRRVGREGTLLTMMLRRETRGLVPQSLSVKTTRVVVGHRRDQGLRRSLSVFVHKVLSVSIDEALLEGIVNFLLFRRLER